MTHFYNVGVLIHREEGKGYWANIVPPSGPCLSTGLCYDLESLLAEIGYRTKPLLSENKPSTREIVLRDFD